MKPHYVYLLVLCCAILYVKSSGAQAPPINWNYEAVRISPQEAVLSITAHLAPGWHLYTQYLKPGGPIPTRFSYEFPNAVRMEGVTEEKGKAITYYDSLYEMKITWYLDQVAFKQRFQINQLEATVSGAVEYMICNEQTCVPREEKFRMKLPDYQQP